MVRKSNLVVVVCVEGASDEDFVHPLLFLFAKEVGGEGQTSFARRKG